MEALEIEADMEAWSSLVHNNNNNTSVLPLSIQSSIVKQQWKQTSAHFISISEIREFI